MRALNEPQTSRKSSGDGDGTTGALLTPPKNDLIRSTNLPKIVPFLRYSISLFLRLDCQPICVDRRVRPGTTCLSQ